MCHFYPSIDCTALTISQFIGLINRIPDVMGAENAAPPSPGDQMELEWRRNEYGI